MLDIRKGDKVEVAELGPYEGWTAAPGLPFEVGTIGTVRDVSGLYAYVEFPPDAFGFAFIRHEIRKVSSRLPGLDGE